MSARADEERAACREAADDPRRDHEEAVAALLVGHVRMSGAGACSCGDPGRLGAMHERHQAEELLALLTRRGWRP